MKTEIIPVINSQKFEDIKYKIDLLKDLNSHFHIDISDREFTGYDTWKNHYDLDKIDANITFDLHLMISLKPQEIIKWNKQNLRRFILHLEASSNPDGLLKITKKTNKQIFIAWSPNVEFIFIEKYLKYVAGVLILGVYPGKSGQKFLEKTYENIEKILNIATFKKLKIMIDGGVNKENFDKILSYQPDYIAMGSAIYNSENPRESFLYFKNKITGK